MRTLRLTAGGYRKKSGGKLDAEVRELVGASSLRGRLMQAMTTPVGRAVRPVSSGAGSASSSQRAFCFRGGEGQFHLGFCLKFPSSTSCWEQGEQIHFGVRLGFPTGILARVVRGDGWVGGAGGRAQGGGQFHLGFGLDLPLGSLAGAGLRPNLDPNLNWNCAGSVLPILRALFQTDEVGASLCCLCN